MEWHPEVLILDEPTSGLDLFIRREFLASMIDLAGAEPTILISSHGIAEVERGKPRCLLSRGPFASGRFHRGTAQTARARAAAYREHATLGTVLEHGVSSRLWQAVLQDPDPIEMEKLCCREDIFEVEESPLNLEEMYTGLLARFHRPRKPRESSNGWDGTSAAVKMQSVRGRSRRETQEEEEVEPL
jgi:hypothetical protein